MRSYPRNSPEAAARIVALVLISDGHVCRSEYEAFNQMDGPSEIGLPPQRMPEIVQSLCEDLSMGGFDGLSLLTHLDDGLLASLMREVDDPRLQRQVMRIASSVVHADRHLSDGEAAMLAAICRHWQTTPNSWPIQAMTPTPLTLTHAWQAV